MNPLSLVLPILLWQQAMAIGKTTIYNAACEPYVQQLCRMLNKMGAKIEGIGSNLLHIEGVNYLAGTEHRMLPDMIESGIFYWPCGHDAK
jgi:UDP-N-acetylglucosamine 1-carboxyvinyltransferase